MRAPARTTRRPRARHRDGLPIGIAAGALALAAAGIGPAAPATAALPTVDVVVNGHFDQGNRMTAWSCDPGQVLPPSDAFGQLAGHPTDTGTAGCTQTVNVEPNSSYRLSARVSGPYVFAGVTGSGTTDLTLWSNQADWNVLSGTVTTGPDTRALKVYFHGWYQQGPYRISSFELWGPGQPRNSCVPTPPVAGDSPSPSASPCYLTPAPSVSGS
ncbi:carbohydrate binding domain-containing protein [Kitasatospora sp. NPDC059646]|uniref:carbohydrate binding domain-containing protein n=1 Tax=Kitasatospora sp. NPDC059646 TaxID=3346893 RepID=UPI0036920237